MISFIDLFIGFVINLIVAFIIVRFIYYPQSHKKNFVITSMAFNTVIFFLLSVLGNASITIGVGFGLFALFSMLRYRTSPLSSREMTYLFTLIALPAINSLLYSGHSLMLMFFVNLVVVSMLFILEKGWGFHYEKSRSITYDNIEMLKPENELFLLSDLQRRTGMPVKRVKIKNMNLVSGTASINIFFDVTDTEEKPPSDLNPLQFHAATMDRFSVSDD